MSEDSSPLSLFSAPPEKLGPLCVGVNDDNVRGLYATRNIRAGEVLLLEKPLYAVSGADNDRSGLDLDASILNGVLEVLSKGDKQAKTMGDNLAQLWPQTLEQVTEEDRERVSKKYAGIIEAAAKKHKDTTLTEDAILLLIFVIQCNAFASGIYLYGSLFNHSCRPNAMRNAPTARNAPSEYIAVESIKEGTEVTASYFDVQELLTPSRQQTLSDVYLFKCKCTRCAKPIALLEAFQCPVRCHATQGYVPFAATACVKCGTEVPGGKGAQGVLEEETKFVRKILGYINNLRERMESVKSAKEQTEVLVGYYEEAAKRLHPRHLLLARISKIILAATAAQLGGPSPIFKMCLALYVLHAYTLRQTQALYLPITHPDLATTLQDISQGIEMAAAHDPSALKQDGLPDDWSQNPEGALSKFGAQFEKIAAMYS